jgi:Tfp pilus assembly pilus retraction ATPase PilT
VEPSELHGLVVIAGRTGSCKSQIAKALIETQLEGKPDRHLVTYEDPIERKIKTPGPTTSREKGKDVSDLGEATRNALRQKPAVLFVGETRDPEEWDMLLTYAGTGHLVVTTAHAGSLIEAMGNILQATEAKDPTARSVVGERLLAVVHLKSDRAETEVGILIPALWRRTSEGIKALMSEGLSSVVPNTPPRLSTGREKREPFPSSIGRYWFARELLEKEAARGKLENPEEIKNLALEWDLEGV